MLRGSQAPRPPYGYMESVSNISISRPVFLMPTNVLKSRFWQDRHLVMSNDLTLEER